MYSNASSFAEYMGLTNVGDRPQGSSSQSISGDQSVAFLDYGNGSGHAVVLTGNAGPGSYYYYDPQNGTTGTLSANDPSIMQTYGY